MNVLIHVIHLKKKSGNKNKGYVFSKQDDFLVGVRKYAVQFHKLFRKPSSLMGGFLRVGIIKTTRILLKSIFRKAFLHLSVYAGELESLHFGVDNNRQMG